MTVKATTVFCVVALATCVWAQGTGSALTRSTYIGVVTGRDVYVRSGPGDAYPCTMLSAPAKVTVVKVESGWLKIQAPPGCYSVVEKDFVQLNVGGKTGTVIGRTVFARAAGPLRTEKFSYIQCRLRQGQTVRVIAQGEKYYKIASPPDAYFWVSKRYVMPEAQYAALQRTKAAAPPIRPAIGPTTRPAPKVSIGPVPAAAKRSTVPAVATGQAPLDAFRAAESDFRAECKRPAPARDYQSILDKFKAINVGNVTYLQPYIDERVSFLEQSIADAKAIAEADKLIQQVQIRIKEYDVQISKVEVAIPQARRKKGYAAKGILAPSRIFPGGATAPKRYIVRTPASGRVTAYVQCTTGSVVLADFVGKHVAITGKSRYDAALAADVIEAEEVTLLAGDVRPPDAPKPTIIPKARPAVTPVPKARPIVTPVPKARPIVTPVPKAKPIVTPVPKARPIVTPVPKAKPSPILKPTPLPKARPKGSPLPRSWMELEPALRPKPIAAPTKATPKKPASPAKTLPLKPIPKKPVTPAKAKPVVPAKAAPKTPAKIGLPIKAKSPTTKPAKTKAAGTKRPLPPTGLPLVQPDKKTTKSPINEEEFK